MKRLSGNNQGLTLVELMIIIAIMAILTSIVGINISLAFSRDAENCAKKIDTELEKVRMSSMSERGDFRLELARTPNGPRMDYVSELAGRTPDEIIERNRALPSQVAISFEGDGAALSVMQIEVAFDKSTGRVIEIRGDGTVLDIDVLRIRCLNSDDRRVATVVLIRRTGKHYVEYSVA